MSGAEPKPVRSRVAVTWDEVARDAAALAARVPAGRPWRGVIAVARGGLVPAVLVSRSLGIALIESISLSTNAEQPQDRPWHLALSRLGDGLDWLLIDDLADSGATIRAVKSVLPKVHAGVLYAKPAGRPFVDSFARAFDQDGWIDFPWEAAAPDILR
jgi:xanthine phosphoribosyltransferase